MKQITLADWIQTSTPTAPAGMVSQVDQAADNTGYFPICYTCRHALRRGRFRLCAAGRRGYRRTGERIECNKYKLYQEEKDGNTERN